MPKSVPLDVVMYSQHVDHEPMPDGLYLESVRSAHLVFGDTHHSLIVRAPSGTHYRIAVPAGLLREIRDAWAEPAIALADKT